MVPFGQPLLSVLLSLELDDHQYQRCSALLSFPSFSLWVRYYAHDVHFYSSWCESRCVLFLHHTSAAQLTHLSLPSTCSSTATDHLTPCPTYQALHDAQYVNTFVLHTAHRASTRGNRPVATIHVVCFTCCCCRPPRTVICIALRRRVPNVSLLFRPVFTHWLRIGVSIIS
jgi:hypothetical protein